MRAHNVDNDVPAKLGEVVRSYDGIFIPGQNIVQPCLIFDEIVDSWKIFQSPFHVRDKPGEGEALLFAVIEHFLNQSEHSILIEMTVAQVGIRSVAQLEAAAAFGIGYIDARRRQPV